MGRRFNGSQGRVRRALSWEFVALPDASLALRTPKHKGTLQDWAGELADFSLLGRVIALVWIGTGTPLLAPRQALEPL